MAAITPLWLTPVDLARLIPIRPAKEWRDWMFIMDGFSELIRSIGAANMPRKMRGRWHVPSTFPQAYARHIGKQEGEAWAVAWERYRQHAYGGTQAVPQ